MDEDENEKSNGGIQVIARAAKILRVLKNEQSGLTLTQIANAVALPRSTVQRIVGALVQEALLTPSSASGGVRLGPEITSLAGEVQPSIIEAARPYLIDLRNTIGETVDLAEFRGNHLMFIDQILGDQRLVARSRIGEVFPLHNTANGKACLAWLTVPEARKSALESAGGAFDAIDALMKQVREIQASGLAYDIEENAPGISAIGTAFRHRSGKILAVSVPMPATRFEDSKIDIGRQLIATRQKMIAAIGEKSE